MTRRVRRTLFYVLVGLFFVIGAAVVLYAQGWRLDLATWQPEKVGGIFVRSFPQDATISLNDRPVQNQAGILSHGTLISDLFPRSYQLSLSKDGYDDWHENVSAYPSLVTELKYAVLVPHDDVVVSSGTISEFSSVSGEMVLKAPTGPVTWRGITIGSGDIVSESATFKDIIIKNATTGAYSLYDFDEASSTNLSAVFINNGIDPKSLTSVVIDPYDASKIIAGNDQNIWIFDATQRTLSPIAERAPAGISLGSGIATSASFLVWTRYSNASATTAIVFYDKFAKTFTLGSSSVPGQNAVLKWITNQTLGVLQSDGSLYLYDTASGQFQKLADDVRDFEATTDGALVAAVERNSMEIFSFSDANTYHRFNLPDAERVLWYKDEGHLFIIYPDHVAFLDLEDAGLDNVTMVADGTLPSYDPQENELLLINPTGQLIQFAFPN